MKDKAPDLIIAAGGTGGHIMPALAVVESLPAELRIVWWGASDRLEAKIVPDAGIHFRGFSLSAVRGKSAKGIALFKAFLALIQMLWLGLRARPKVILGMGGFTAGPAGVVAKILRVPLIIHDQNAIAGRTNSLLAKIATRVYATYPQSFAANIDAQTIGNPVREGIRALAQCKRPPLQWPIKVLVLGGSQGAQSLNTILPEAAALFSEKFVWRHQAGAGNANKVEKEYKKHDVVASSEDFIADMAEAFSWCDMVISRAGATTVAELVAARIPAIFVPYPHAVDDHQTANAKALHEAGAAWLIADAELYDELPKVLQHLSLETLIQAVAAMTALPGGRAHDDLAKAIQEFL